MFIDYLINNLVNFEYEINFLKTLWFNHFIDFCILLILKDFSFIFLIIYIVILCIANLSMLIERLNFTSLIIITPVKLLSDIVIIYLISKFLFIIFYYSVFIYFRNLNEILFFAFFLIFGLSFILSIIFVPLFFFKLSNRYVYKKIFTLYDSKNY
mgnify:CR=1 FL=1